MTVTIIFVNFQSKNLVRQNLRAIDAWKNTGVITQVVIVDNASGDGSGDALRACAEQLGVKVRVLEQKENRGFAAGVNAGIRESSSDAYLILNPDVLISEELVARLSAFMVEHPRAGVVGPQLLKPDGSMQYSAFSFPTLMTPIYRRTVLGRLSRGRRALSRFLRSDTLTAQSALVDWIQGSCMMVRAAAVLDVGKMDERFFMYFEDTDWCRRFVEKGWEVWYVPDAVAVHYFNRSSAEYEGAGALFNRATWIHVRAWIKYAWKWRRQGIPRR